MGILLILAQVVLAILALVAHVFALNLWLVFLPAILLGTLWLIGRLTGSVLMLDRVRSMYVSAPRRRR